MCHHVLRHAPASIESRTAAASAVTRDSRGLASVATDLAIEWFPPRFGCSVIDVAARPAFGDPSRTRTGIPLLERDFKFYTGKPDRARARQHRGRRTRGDTEAHERQPRSPEVASENDPVELALAALDRASAAGQWAVAEVLARELEAQRKARAGVVQLDTERWKRDR